MLEEQKMVDPTSGPLEVKSVDGFQGKQNFSDAPPQQLFHSQERAHYIRNMHWPPRTLLKLD